MNGEFPIYRPTVETTAEHRARAWRLRYPDCKTWSDESAPGFAHAEVERIAVELAALAEVARAEGAAAEREACAQVAERAGRRPEVVPISETIRRHAYIKGREVATDDIAAAIRARSGDGDPRGTHDT